MMIILLISAGALVLVTGGCVIAGTMQTPADRHSPAGRAAARERAKAHRRAMRIRNPRPWEAPEQTN